MYGNLMERFQKLSFGGTCLWRSVQWSFSPLKKFAANALFLPIFGYTEQRQYIYAWRFYSLRLLLGELFLVSYLSGYLFFAGNKSLPAGSFTKGWRAFSVSFFCGHLLWEEVLHFQLLPNQRNSGVVRQLWMCTKVYAQLVTLWHWVLVLPSWQWASWHAGLGWRQMPSVKRTVMYYLSLFLLFWHTNWDGGKAKAIIET